MNEPRAWESLSQMSIVPVRCGSFLCFKDHALNLNLGSGNLQARIHPFVHRPGAIGGDRQPGNHDLLRLYES